MPNEAEAQQPAMPSRLMHENVTGISMPSARPETSMPQRDMTAEAPESAVGMDVKAIAVGGGMPDRLMQEPPSAAEMPQPRMETT